MAQETTEGLWLFVEMLSLSYPGNSNRGLRTRDSLRVDRIFQKRKWGIVQLPCDDPPPYYPIRFAFLAALNLESWFSPFSSIKSAFLRRSFCWVHRLLLPAWFQFKTFLQSWDTTWEGPLLPTLMMWPCLQPSWLFWVFLWSQQFGEPEAPKNFTKFELSYLYKNLFFSRNKLKKSDMHAVS